ncbi:MAG: SCP2 sterol-binding domain-containing protein [Myxococcota bacterium]|nr:SCP2 sterol-binding domain-containing protein [Myxococcota bacterium]
MSEQHHRVVMDRDKMNLAGLMLGRILTENLTARRGTNRLSRLKGRLGVVAGRMPVTLDFDGHQVAITHGLTPPLRATVKGSLNGLLGVGMGKSATRAFVSGKVSVGGNPIFALRVLRLLRIDTDKEIER